MWIGAYKNQVGVASDGILMHFHSQLPVTLATDVSPLGISGVLSHVVNGEEHPTAFVSRPLMSAKKGYSHLDKEATAVYWCFIEFCNSFLDTNLYLLLITNLHCIFNPNKNLPATTVGQLLRYSTFLNKFNYSIEHRNSR